MMDLAELQTDINNAQHIVFLTGAGVLYPLRYP